MTGKQYVTAVAFLVGTLLVVGGFGAMTVAGDLEYRYAASYESTNSTHFVANTTVDSMENVTDFESLTDAEQETVREASNGSLAFSDRDEVSNLPENVNVSGTFYHYDVTATPDTGDSTNLLSGLGIGAGLLAVLYSLRRMNHERAD